MMPSIEEYSLSSSAWESSKNLAGIGAILLFLSFIPVVGIIGIILLLVGMKGLADYYKEPAIYQDALWGLIFGIIGIVAVTVLFFGGLFGSIFAGFALGAGFFLGGLLFFVLVLVVAFIFYVLMATYFKRAFSSLAQKSGEHMFETAGLLLLIGAVLTIVLVGVFLILVAWILLTVAFFSMSLPSQPGANAQAPSPPKAPLQQATRFCPNCSGPVDANATYCPHCGKQLVL
jgi:uncharacterized membrane protein